MVYNFYSHLIVSTQVSGLLKDTRKDEERTENKTTDGKGGGEEVNIVLSKTREDGVCN